MTYYTTHTAPQYEHTGDEYVEPYGEEGNERIVRRRDRKAGKD